MGKEEITNENEINSEAWPALVPAFCTNASMLSQCRVMLSDYPSAFADSVESFSRRIWGLDSFSISHDNIHLPLALCLDPVCRAGPGRFRFVHVPGFHHSSVSLPESARALVGDGHSPARAHDFSGLRPRLPRPRLVDVARQQ